MSDILPFINSRILMQLTGCVLALFLTACTTSNQQSLGVGVSPTPSSTTAPAKPNPTGDASTQTALASVAESSTPSQTAVLGVASPDDSSKNTTEITRVGFLPITGAPQKAVSSLSRALGSVSKQHKIGIAGNGDKSVDYQLKGYMSALNEGPRTTVTFYWDVLDKSGRRLYRINGFEQENGAKSNPWDGVSNATMQKIANRTMGSFAKWVKRKGA
jgi:hypothetical protein